MIFAGSATSPAGPVLVAHIGADTPQRLAELVRRTGDPQALLDEPGAMVWARGATIRGESDERIVDWTQDGTAGGDPHTIAFDGDRTVITGSQAGVVPLFLQIGEESVTISSDLDALIRSAPIPPRPDPAGILQMVTASGPIGQRTLYQGIRRLQPGEICTIEGGRAQFTSRWAWLDPPTDNSIDDLAGALAAEMDRVVVGRRVVSLLSGGWDSRLLLALARSSAVAQGIRAFTTSSDTGTIMEELVAIQVAAGRGFDHEIVFPRRDMFAADLELFTRSVGFHTAFHIWLVPIVRRLASLADNGGLPLVLDGLGGGLFIGGSFSDQSGHGSVLDARVAELLKYHAAGESVLRRPVLDAARQYTETDAIPRMENVSGHPYGNVLAAYQTRTVPGISLAPHGLVASVADVSTPFLAPDVVHAAMGLPPAVHEGDKLYPVLLRNLDPALAELATAQEQVPWPRPHPRRITSIEAVTVIRDLALREPVRQLLAPGLITAPLEGWRAALGTTAGQHLLRGLATLALWAKEHPGSADALDLGELGL